MMTGWYGDGVDVHVDDDDDGGDDDDDENEGDDAEADGCNDKAGDRHRIPFRL